MPFRAHGGTHAANERLGIRTPPTGTAARSSFTGVVYTYSVWLLRSVLVIALSAPAAVWAQTAPVLPPPGYGNTVYLFVDALDFLASDAAFQPEADAILAGLHGGPYARVGTSGFVLVDLPWTADLANPVLSSPSPEWLSFWLSRAQARGLAVHLGSDAGVSRDTLAYDSARREDRRNAQWYMDGTLQKTSVLGSNEIWITPSRYARKVHRHLETKVRAFARMLVDLRLQFPDTLVSMSGDGEMELNYGGLDDSVPFEFQMIADYSPFAIAEFRDWIQHAGLYGPGQLYDGQGFSGGGAQYQGASGLSSFNAAYGTSFASWNLLYFDWDVAADPVDGDPKAIPDTAYEGAGWTPFPSSGPGFVPGGFDAPRSVNGTAPAFWQLWHTFRATMVANYQRDFAAWVTTTAGAGGNHVEADRWYSHQIPADYLGGTFPGCLNPDPRLRTSASPMSTANVAPFGSLGLTAFDTYGYDATLNRVVYRRTSLNLLDALRGVPNWGFVEWSPSYPIGAADPDWLGIAFHAKLAYDAGAHILNYLLWQHFVGTPENPPTSPQALNYFLSQVKNQPRDGGTVAYAPTQVSGLSGQWVKETISLSWSDLVFPGVAGFRYFDWPAFAGFEVWRGASGTFGTADGVSVVGTSISSQAAGIVPDASRPFYRVRAVTRDGNVGAFSGAVWLPRPVGTAFFSVAPCRQFDSRAGSPIAANGTQLVPLTGTPCGIPAGAKAVSANLTVTQTSAPGSIAIVAGDAAGPTTTSNLSFGAGLSRANNTVLLLASDGSGTVRVENGSAGTLHAILDVNGYFQ